MQKKRRGKKNAAPEAVPERLRTYIKTTPTYVFGSRTQHSIGGQHTPYVWKVKTPGYGVANLVFGLKGKVGKNYNIQIRHDWPMGIYTFDSRTGTLPPGGFTVVEFSGIRPRKPEMNIVVFSTMDDEDFDMVSATLYATIA